MLGEAAFVWNHALALQKSYYKLYKGYIHVNQLKAHFQKRITRCRLGAQTVQELLERLDASYQRFFTHLAKRPPKFKKGSQFGSFVFKQDGFKLNSNILVINRIKKHFKFSYSRPYEGKVKNVRVKRIHPGEYRLFIVTDSTPIPYHKTHDGAMVGMDFGFKTFLTLSDGTAIQTPLWFKTNLNKLRKVDRYYPSSKTCRHCGYVNRELTLRDRQWVCPDCGAVLDRDLNAAINILRQGIASSGSPRKTKVTLRKGR